MKQSAITILGFICLATGFVSCKKQDDFLNVIPATNVSAIKTLNDVQSVLQNERVFNYSSSSKYGASSTDDYYLLAADYLNLATTDQNVYTWAKILFPAGSNSLDWSAPYKQIYYANTALDALSRMSIPDGNKTLANQLTGTALFYRSYAYYSLLQSYTLPYDSATAAQQLGVPLRLDVDISKLSTRANEKECYDQVIVDLKTATTLLPVNSQFPSQPNKVACNAMLARVFLGIGRYSEALVYANACLQLKNSLFDYNTIIPAPNFPGIADPNKQYPLSEMIYLSTFDAGPITNLKRARADTSLYAMYEANDIRKLVFFSNFYGYITFQGSYQFGGSGGYGLFDGLATDEVYLIRAECNARFGNKDNAMIDLNALLRNRYKKGTFTDRTATTADDALVQILTERRKELCFRGLRWTDLRRLNKESRFAVTLTRNINGTIYTLPPNDNRYALQIPDNEIQLSGIQQNPR